MLWCVISHMTTSAWWPCYVRAMVSAETHRIYTARADTDISIGRLVQVLAKQNQPTAQEIATLSILALIVSLLGEHSDFDKIREEQPSKTRAHLFVKVCAHESI